MRIFRRFCRGSLVAVGWLLAVVSNADAQSVPLLPAVPDQSTLHLSETAQRDVARDLLHAALYAEATDADAAKVQATINQRMAAALVRIKQVPDINVETAGYSVYRDNPSKTPALWHGSQSVTITGKDFTALLNLVGALQQQGMVMQNLSPDISRDARQSVEDALTNEALTRLQQRADRIAATLGTKVAGLRSLNVGNVNPPPPVFRVMMAAPSVSSAAPAPVAEGGSATVSVTVTADISLAPK